MAVEIIRHLPIFNVDKFNPKRVEIIGCGAVGSRVTLGLGKLGVENIRVWDFDTVEDHNIANQAFGLKQIGKPKVVATAELLKEFCGIEIETMKQKVDGSQKLEGVVFMCPDTMEARKEIWLKAIKLRPQVDALFECRMGTDNCRLYYVKPLSPKHVKAYEGSFYEDAETEESACGSKISVGPTAEFTSALMQWGFIRHFNNIVDPKKHEAPENEAIVAINPIMTLLNQFES